MRRTAWNHIWIPHAQVGLEEPDAEEPIYPVIENDEKQPDANEDEHEQVDVQDAPNVDKGKQPEQNGVDMEDVERSKIVTTTGNFNEDADWGLQGRGLKVWLRRTFIFQLMSLVER